MLKLNAVEIRSHFFCFGDRRDEENIESFREDQTIGQVGNLELFFWLVS